MKPRVELIYDADCPNVAQTRAMLLRAFAKAGVRSSWTEWDRSAPDSPAYMRGYGSPTMLINGVDVAGSRLGETNDSCRLYPNSEGGLRRLPPVDDIAAALAAARGQRERLTTLLTLPGIGAFLLPVGACPACWPVYAGLLGSVGLGFLLQVTYMLPIALALVGLAILGLAAGARSRRRYGPLGVGTAGAGFALAGKFVFSIDLLVYAGLGLLAMASLWNAWPWRSANSGSCAKCAPRGPETLTHGAQEKGTAL